MSMTDPVADLLTRIRNANRLGKNSVAAPFSRVKEGVAAALKREGFVQDYEVFGDGPKRVMNIVLKYGPEGEKVIRAIKRVSKPGRRVYRGLRDLEPVLDGLGIAVLSTSKGILSDREARRDRLGGEVLCEVW